MAESPSVREWVKGARAGDVRAWAALYVEFWPNVFQAVRRQGFVDAHAEDLAQRVLGVYLPKRLPHLRKFRSAAHFAAWLERLTVNEAHDVRRRRRRVLLESLPVRFPGPGVDRALDSLALLKRLARLTSAQRAVVDLYLQGHSGVVPSPRTGFGLRLKRPRRASFRS